MPAMPWTPAPGGVAEEQMKMPESGVAYGFHGRAGRFLDDAAMAKLLVTARNDLDPFVRL